jgi:hypothetical protein
MKPIRLRMPASSLDDAEAALGRYLPGLDVQLFAYRDGTVLLPPHLLRALQIAYGKRGALAILETAGLVEGVPVRWREVIEWGQVHAEVWARRKGTQPSFEPAASGLDWHLTMCGVDKAWKIVGGRDHIDWGNVRVGQIDTGYTEHPVFGFPNAPWIDVAGARTFIPDPPPGNGSDTLSGASGGHGTTSGSLLSGIDSTESYFGVAPRVPLVPARINDCVIIDQRAHEFEAATRYLVDDAKVSVINVSMGTFLKVSAPRPIRRALDYCYERGVILFGAAGNVPAPNWPAYPAALQRAIAVAGVTRQAMPWSGSSYGLWVDFSAPAKHVRRAATKTGPVYSYTDDGGGTTFAAAIASGAAALWLVAHAAIVRQRYPEPWQRIEAFRHMARSTACVPPGWRPDEGFGAGILNLGLLMVGALLPEAAELVRRPDA